MYALLGVHGYQFQFFKSCRFDFICTLKTHSFSILIIRTCVLQQSTRILHVKITSKLKFNNQICIIYQEYMDIGYQYQQFMCCLFDFIPEKHIVPLYRSAKPKCFVVQLPGILRVKITSNFKSNKLCMYALLGVCEQQILIQWGRISQTQVFCSSQLEYIHVKITSKLKSNNKL